jgi:hypothetical protein
VIAIAFPEKAKEILLNKIYLMIGGAAILLILFLFWLKAKSNY